MEVRSSSFWAKTLRIDRVLIQQSNEYRKWLERQQEYTILVEACKALNWIRTVCILGCHSEFGMLTGVIMAVILTL